MRTKRAPLCWKLCYSTAAAIFYLLLEIQFKRLVFTHPTIVQKHSLYSLGIFTFIGHMKSRQWFGWTWYLDWHLYWREGFSPNNKPTWITEVLNIYRYNFNIYMYLKCNDNFNQWIMIQYVLFSFGRSWSLLMKIMNMKLCCFCVFWMNWWRQFSGGSRTAL